MKKNIAVLLSAIILVSILAGCVSTEARSAADTRNIELLIKQTYRDALAGGDTDTIIDAYTEDGVMAPQRASTAIGKDNIRQVYEGIFSALVLDLQFTIDEVIVSGNYATVRSTSAGTALVKATNEKAPDANRELWTMQKVDGKWKIARYMFNKTGE
jgi:uncharacterized protein (TIGR02246 family)